LDPFFPSFESPPGIPTPNIMKQTLKKMKKKKKGRKEE